MRRESGPLIPIFIHHEHLSNEDLSKYIVLGVNSTLAVEDYTEKRRFTVNNSRRNRFKGTVSRLRHYFKGTEDTQAVCSGQQETSYSHHFNDVDGEKDNNSDTQYLRCIMLL